MELNEELGSLILAEPSPRAPHRTRSAIVVVGSHRSGTSALARVLSLVGCDLPKHLMPPLKGSNELGFWEPELVVEAHETFLAAVGSAWDDVASLPDGAFTSAAASELRQRMLLLLHEEYGTSPLFVLKDPRISRLLPIWFAILNDFQAARHVALCVRNPLEVAASLKARDGFTTTKSLLLWLRYTLEAERHSRGVARSIVVYDELLRDWQRVLARLGDDLAVTWPLKSHRAVVEVENFLSEEHRHHAFDWTELEGRADVVSWVKEVYFALRASNPVDVLDQVWDELLRADAAFGPIVEEVRVALRTSQAQSREAAAARDALAAEIESRSAELTARSAEVEQLQEQVSQLTSAVAASDSRAAADQAEVVRLRGQRDTFAGQVELVGAEVTRLTAELESAESRATASEAQARTVNEELDASRASVAQLEEAAASANARVAAVEAQAERERAALLRDLETARADGERLRNRISAVEELRVRSEEEVAVVRRERDVLKSELETVGGLVAELETKARRAEERALAADELVTLADTELAASEAERERLQDALVHAIAEHGALQIVVERLEADLESAVAAREDREQAWIAIAAEVAEQRAGADSEHARLVSEAEALRGELERAHSETALVRSKLEDLEATAARERARLVAELEAAQSAIARLVEARVDLEGAVEETKALLDAVLAVTKRRNPRRRGVSQLGSWLLPPTPRKLGYLRRYLFLRWSGEFDVDSYVLANPDVLRAGLNPLMHYVEYGRAEGRKMVAEPRPPSLGETRFPALMIGEGSESGPPPDPDSRAEAAPAIDDPAVVAPDESADDSTSSDTPILTDDLREALAGDFDSEYYRGIYEDIDRVGIDPLEHYFYTGWREGRDPSSTFSTSYYLSSNPDVAAADLNPLVHYVLTGKREGREPYPPTGFKRQALQTLRSLEEEIDHWQVGAELPDSLMDRASLSDALDARLGARRQVVISCSHDDYTRVVGGAQLCVGLEQAAFVERGCAYVNLHPVRPLPVLSRETQPEALGLRVVCDGQTVGCASAEAVIDALSELCSDRGLDFGLVVHALNGHSPEVIVDLHHRLAPRWAWLWLHDYFGICPSVNLLRNRIEYCYAPEPDSQGCTICVFGEERLRHLPRFHALLESVPFNLVAPSQFMADRWKQFFGDDQLEIAVHENGTLRRAPSGIDEIDPVGPADGPARVAFLGMPATHKGWEIFMELVRRSAASGDYRFYHFGDGRYRSPNVESRTVSVLESGPLGMIEALRTEGVDVAIIWSLWEESFSFTTYEALTAGAAVLTNKGSGNIARVVGTTGEGLVFDDERELFAAFEEGLILDLVQARRDLLNSEVRTFTHSRLTADLANFDA